MHRSLTRLVCGWADAWGGRADQKWRGSTGVVYHAVRECSSFAWLRLCMYVRRMFGVPHFFICTASAFRRPLSDRGRRHHALSSNEVRLALHLPRKNGRFSKLTRVYASLSLSFPPRPYIDSFSFAFLFTFLSLLPAVVRRGRLGCTRPRGLISMFVADVEEKSVL